MKPFLIFGSWWSWVLFSRLGLFIWQFYLLFESSNSWVIPGHHFVVLTNASVLLLPGYAWCIFGKPKCLSSWGMKRTTTLKMIPLCIVIAFFCCSSPFFHLWTLFPTAALNFFYDDLKGSVYFKFSFGDCWDYQITLKKVDVVECERHSIVFGFVIIKSYSAQSMCVGHLLSWCLFQLKLKILQSYCPFCDSSWWWLRDLILCKETSEWFVLGL